MPITLAWIFKVFTVHNHSDSNWSSFGRLKLHQSMLYKFLLLLASSSHAVVVLNWTFYTSFLHYIGYIPHMTLRNRRVQKWILKMQPTCQCQCLLNWSCQWLKRVWVDLRIAYNLHWTEVISSHHTIFAPVQTVKMVLTKFKFYKKVQGFVETLLYHILLLPWYSNEWYLQQSTRFNTHINTAVSHGFDAIFCIW